MFDISNSWTGNKAGRYLERMEEENEVEDTSLKISRLTEW
jgi:hypothetical protein